MHCAGFWQVVLWLCDLCHQKTIGAGHCESNKSALGQAAFEQWATENRAAIEAKCEGA